MWFLTFCKETLRGSIRSKSASKILKQSGVFSVCNERYLKTCGFRPLVSNRTFNSESHSRSRRFTFVRCRLSHYHNLTNPFFIQNPINCSQTYVSLTVSRTLFSGSKDTQEVQDKKIGTDADVKTWINKLKEDFHDASSSFEESDSNFESVDSSSTSDESSDSEFTSDSDESSDSDEEAVETIITDIKEYKTTLKNDPFSTLDANNKEEDVEDFTKDMDENYEGAMEKNTVPFNLNRGETGVFDIEDIVEVLKEENTQDVCVIQVPSDYKYVDHMVLATGRSTRQLIAVAELIKWLYKRKRVKGDPVSCKIEGRDTSNWMALDLGNIAVHLFLAGTRQQYDLETLWTVGPEYDEKFQQQNETNPFAFLNPDDFFLDESANQEVAETNLASGITQDMRSMENVKGWHGTSPGSAADKN